MVHVPASVLVQFLSCATLVKLSFAKQCGLNLSQFLALLVLGNASGLSIKEMKEKLSIPGSSLTFTIDALEKRGLVKRQRSKEDRRQWFLSLTAKGRRLYADVLRRESKVLSAAFDNLSEEERAAFLRVAEEIVSSGRLKYTEQDLV
jgi:MarR family 2-MHQ and catechol resistance regulon transcriptional repressor